MRRTYRLAGTVVLLAILGSSTGCRSLMFWRKPTILGQAQLTDANGTLLTDRKPEGITMNFINLQGSLEDTLLSVQTDPLGQFRSPELVPGEYAVEASLAGFVIERQNVLVRSHEYKRVNFVLRKIGERTGRSQRESEDDNIPTPGEVQIGPPPSF